MESTPQSKCHLENQFTSRFTKSKVDADDVSKANRSVGSLVSIDSSHWFLVATFVSDFFFGGHRSTELSLTKSVCV